MVVFKRIKAFRVDLEEKERVYSSGEKVAGRVEVEVAEVTRVSAVRFLACGVARVLWIRGPHQCKQEMEYLRHESVLQMEDQPSGEQVAEELGLAAWGGGFQVPCVWEGERPYRWPSIGFPRLALLGRSGHPLDQGVSTSATLKRGENYNSQNSPANCGSCSPPS